MRPLIDYDEFCRNLREASDDLGGTGSPIRNDTRNATLDPDHILDMKTDLEQSAAASSKVVAVMSPATLLELLYTVDAFERVPAKLKGEDGSVELPENFHVYGVPLRVALGFPESMVVLLEPWNVTLDGGAVDRSRVGIVENLSDPEIPDDGPADLGDVRARAFPTRDPEGSTGENTTPAGDIDRKGDAFVPDPEGDA